jgi:hypothetical protein
MALKLTIDNGNGPIDYTRYVLPDSITIEDSINVPTLLSFTLSNIDDNFVVPVRSAYCRFFSGKFNVPLATGFVTAFPSTTFLGMANNIPSFGFQRYTYDIQVTSDEWLLNVKTVPFLPPFVNLGQGQILAKLANLLVPNFFDTTSFVASGDLIADFPYDPTQNWSDLAKVFADSARFRYKVLDKKIYFQPYGDGPLGVSYNETKGERTFNPSLLQTPVQAVPPVNDAIVIGDVEAQNNHEDYFVGDGITGNFPLRHEVFEGASSLLINETWGAEQIDTSLWTVFDPSFAITETGGGLQLQGGDGLGSTYVMANSGVELGGAVNVQAGDFQFVDVCDGIVGGLYSDSSFMQEACIAGFQLAGTNVTPTASGAIGVTMQPMVFGQPIGPIVTSQQNHSYALQLYVSANTWSRYDRPYRTLVGQVFGDVKYAGIGTITFVIADTSVDFPNNPTITLYSASGLQLPEFALFAPINANNLNLALSNTLLGLPPQGGLYVRSLYGATANQFPIDPVGPELQYLLGFGFQNQVATIGTAGDVQQLQFYASSYQTLIGSTLPAVGARIKLQTWEAGTSLARVQDPVAIAKEAKIVGDDGRRTAVFKSLNPLPRTSTECDAAGAAIITDRSAVQWEGTYTFADYFFDGTGVFNPVTGQLAASGYPVPGRFFIVTAPQRGMSGVMLLVSRVTIKVVELRQETLNVVIDYGPDYYLDKILNNFVEFRTDVLTPKDAANPPTPQQLLTVGEFYLPNLDNATVKGLITGKNVVLDMGVVPATGIEIRKADAGWTKQNKDLLYTLTQQEIVIPRTSNEQIFFCRMVNGALYSRFSKVIRLLYPLIPAPPPNVLVDFSLPFSPVIRVQLPLNTDRNIYGVEIDRAFLPLTPCSVITLSSDNPTDISFVDVLGFDGTGAPLKETVELNGTTPVSTIGVFCALETVTRNPMTVFLVNDVNGITWRVTVLDSGQLFATQLPTFRQPPLVFLVDSDTGTTSWLIGIAINGDLFCTQQPFAVSTTGFQLISAAGATFTVQVHSNGKLFTV